MLPVPLTMKPRLHDAGLLARVKYSGCVQTFHASRKMEVATHFKVQPVEFPWPACSVPGTWLAWANLHRSNAAWVLRDHII